MNIDNGTWKRVKDAVVTKSKTFIIGHQPVTEEKQEDHTYFVTNRRGEKYLLRVSCQRCARQPSGDKHE